MIQLSPLNPTDGSSTSRPQLHARQRAEVVRQYLSVHRHREHDNADQARPSSEHANAQPRGRIAARIVMLFDVEFSRRVALNYISSKPARVKYIGPRRPLPRAIRASVLTDSRRHLFDARHDALRSRPRVAC